MIGPFRYDAYAVIRHLGASISSGHYVSLVKDRGRGVWRTFNDDKVSDFDENSTSMGDRIQGEGAYIVFFERIPVTEKA
jgi:ubiquitin carboxyl-terminal hydrolase 8